MCTRRTFLVVALAGVAVLSLAGSAVAATTRVRIVEVSERYAFAPARITVNAGDTVVWGNGTDAPHTVTSNSGGVLDSSQIGPSDTYRHTFSSTGTFAYHCSIHPYMTGSVVVLAAGAPLPATDAVSPSVPRAPDQTAPVVVFALATLLGLGLVAWRPRAMR